MQSKTRSLKTYARKYKRDKRDKRLTPEVTGFTRNQTLLVSAHNAWSSLSTWRDDIRRNEEFVYGDQHLDRVYDHNDSKLKTERQMFREQGLEPSQYNIIRNVIRTIVGFWLSNKTLPSCIAQKDENQEESDILTATLHALYRKNELWKLDIAELKQLLITGLSASKIHYVNRDGDSDVVSDYIDPFTFFVDNRMKDPRYKDCTLVGCFYDLPIDDIAAMFAEGSKDRAKKIRQLYGGGWDEDALQWVETFTEERIEKDFFHPAVEYSGLGRIFEIWRKESAECYWIHDWRNGEYYPDFNSSESDLEKENSLRRKEYTEMGMEEEDMLFLEWEWGRDSYWKYYYLTSTGDVLQEGINPFWHEQPPIVFELHEFFVGKIYPFIKDLIDANKQINKLSAMSELLTKHSAKQLLFMPVENLADEDGYGVDYVERNMTRYDAVIPYKGNQGLTKPEFISSIGEAFTPLNVVSMYLKLSEQVSGVYGALQGQTPTAGTPAQSFLQQSQNSATSLVDLFESINSYRTRRDKMNVQLMQQYYKGKKYIYDQDNGIELLYDEERVKNIDVEISIVENTNTPAYRLMVNDILMQLKQFDTNNMIDLKGLVEVGNWPFKEKLLDYLNQREQEMAEMMRGEQMGQPSGLPEDLAAEMSQYQFPPEVMEQLGTLPSDVQESILQQAGALN